MKFLILGYLTLILSFVACSSDTVTDDSPSPIAIEEEEEKSKTETFTFTSNGTTWKGQIFLPEEYETNKSLPAIYLIDFTEQHFTVVTDEYQVVIGGAAKIEGLNALVVTLEEIPDISAAPYGYQEYYDIFKNMASAVDSKYTDNPSRTFIGRGSEGGLVLMALLLEETETSVFQNFIASDPAGGFTSEVIRLIENEEFPQNKQNKKLHFSFSYDEVGYYDNRIKLINIINEQQYPWLEFEAKEYPNLTYENAYRLAFADGIKFIFEN